MQSQRDPSPGEHAAFSREIVGILADCTGRGPTRLRTTIGPDVICVVLQDTHTKGERALLANGEHALVTEVRRAYHRAMQPALVRAAQSVTGRRVLTVHADHSCRPDVSTISFVLDPMPSEVPPAAALSASAAMDHTAESLTGFASPTVVAETS